ncbi:hypothetical protein ACFL1X_03190 [Candidatus Hydrogenedentota bacterium]
MNRMIETEEAWHQVPSRKRRLGIRMPTPALSGALAILLLALALAYVWSTGGKTPASSPAFTLLSRAWAAEEALFNGEEIVHIVNEIVVKPISNTTLAARRWYPIVSLEATGRPRFHQLRLPAETGEGYTVDDQAWYDPATGQFTRMLTAEGKGIYGNSYDGEAVYSLEPDEEGALRVVRTPIAVSFQAPESPAGFLGIAAGLPFKLDEGNASRFLDAGETVLENGARVQVFKTASSGGANTEDDSYWLFKVRMDNSTITESEWVNDGESMLIVRRVLTETVKKPGVTWVLPDERPSISEEEGRPNASVATDMVEQDVTVQHMVEKADFETYIFRSCPSWTDECKIVDVLDIISPPKRMFSIAYRAGDGRHVVLAQIPSCNMLYGKMFQLFQQLGKIRLVYTSPNGFKVWSVSEAEDKKSAMTLLKGARSIIKCRPSADRTGYLLESPAGTYPQLAVNGQVTE